MSVREPDLFEFAADLVLEQAAALTHGSATATLNVSTACPTCGGTLITDAADPLNARCVCCGKPLRRIT